MSLQCIPLKPLKIITRTQSVDMWTRQHGVQFVPFKLTLISVCVCLYVLIVATILQCLKSHMVLVTYSAGHASMCDTQMVFIVFLLCMYVRAQMLGHENVTKSALNESLSIWTQSNRNQSSLSLHSTTCIYVRMCINTLFSFGKLEELLTYVCDFCVFHDS